MTLTNKDLQAIKDIVDFSIEKSELHMDEKLDALEERVVTRINNEISDIAETQREFLAKMDNHETRIQKLESELAI